MKKLNIYYVFDGLLALALLLFLLSSKSKVFVFGGSALVIITFILVILEAFEKTQLTPTIVTNDSDMLVKYKEESGSHPLDLQPRDIAEGVDGFKISGKVFKACSGTHIVIDKTGRISTKALSGKFANTVRGGFISSAPDESWDLLVRLS